MSEGHRPTNPTLRVPVVRSDAGTRTTGRDELVVEEPMEIRVGTVGIEDESLPGIAVTMRTPGNDFALAAGFLISEGIVADPTDIVSIAYCGLPPEEQEYNVVTVRVRSAVDIERHRRNVFTTSSCGICGKSSIDAVVVACKHPPRCGPVDAGVVGDFQVSLRSEQALFDKTGGLHAAGLFTLTGDRLVVREDIGRHNAVDKVVGWAAAEGRLPLDDVVLVVSGRSSFEIVQKAAVAGVGMIVGVSAPSSLAVSAADDLGVTVVAFARNERFSIYTHPERITGLTTQEG